MQRLHGRTISRGSALGTAAVVRWTGDVAQLPARLLEEMAQAARRGLTEPIDVVLVAEEADRAAALTLPGVRVVGIVAESPGGTAEGALYPVIVDVPGATARIGEDSLVLLDADRGMALVDPDGATVAAHQAERERISPRRRIYIDFEHEPARTLDGRRVLVSGIASTAGQIAKCANDGADGVVLFSRAAGISAEANDDEQSAALTALFRAADGKPVVLIGDLEGVALPALLRAAVAADASLAVHMPPGSEEVAEIRVFLEEAGRELTEAEAEWRPVGLAGVVSPADGPPPDEAELPMHRLLADLTAEWDPTASDLLEWLDGWISAGARQMVTVEVMLPSGSLGAVRPLIGLGAAGIAVAPDEVSVAKQLIRSMDAGEARAELFES